MTTNSAQTNAPILAIAAQLEGIVGADHLYSWKQLEQPWRDRTLTAISPNFKENIAYLACPKTTEELADLLTCTHQNRWGVIPAGAGSKLHWGGLIQPMPSSPKILMVVSTARMNQLIDHAAGDLTVTVEAGMGFAELQAMLAKANQFLAIDPSYPQQATIGGIVATADTGSLRQRYQGVRDMLLGISFVRADGNIAKAGGRVVKNVAGYDLMKLFTGSYGTLGVITQVTLRVYPLPETSQTLILSGDEDAIAEATRILLSSALTPTHADVLSRSLVEALELGSKTGLAVRFQSILPSVKEQMNRLAELGRSLNLTCVAYADDEEVNLWQRLQTQMTASAQSDQIACKIGIQPSHAIALLHQVQALFPTSFTQIYTASGLGRLICVVDSPSPLLKIREICQQNGGFLSVLQAPAELKQQIDIWGYPKNALATMRSLKHQFDPHQLLNPSRFVGGI